MYTWITSWFRKPDESEVINEVIEPHFANLDLPTIDLYKDLSTDSNVVDEEKFSVDENLKNIEDNLTPEVVALLERDLHDYEKVALIFLLYDSTPGNFMALQQLRIGFETGYSQSNVLSEWIKLKDCDWRNKLLEALVIIQNFEVIEKMGFNKNDVCLYFSMHPENTKFIDRIRVELYLICEQFTSRETKQFLSMVEEDVIKKKIPNFHELWGINSPFLEICFLHLLSYRVIINEDAHIELHNLQQILKKMDKLDQAEKLDNIALSLRQQRIKQMYQQEEDNSNLNKQIPKSESQCCELKQSLIAEDDEHKYQIHDPNHIGLCIVINQFHFEKHHPVKLEDRTGTDKDVFALKKTFETNLKMDFEQLNNLRSNEIYRAINFVLCDQFVKKKYSMVFLFILSHGNRGFVYGIDCKPVTIESLEDCLCECKILRGKPKVLVIQACQDELSEDSILRYGYLTDGPSIRNSFHWDNVTDGPSDKNDFLLCMATLEGLTAYRNKIWGTWYIQLLCASIEKYKGKIHFCDIVTTVHNEIEKMVDIHNVGFKMIPRMSSTLKKKLYLQQ